MAQPVLPVTAATSASFNNPTGIAVDGSGNIYIADYYNQRIRKVNASDGKISTVAGNTMAGFSGDGGPATSASLKNSVGIAVDGSGNLYIADQSNNRIRYVCASTSVASASIAGVHTAYPEQNNTLYFLQNCSLQAKLVPAGANPVAGNVADSVWIEPSVPTTANGQPYVQRHYGLTPTLNASTVTGTITLYFTQAEFTAYNAAANHGTDLPVDAADAANNKANLRITKRSGTSSDGTGLYGTYSGAGQVITPTSVAWDAGLNAWAVTFDVTGFSGFFASTSQYVLPLQLLDFNGRLQSSDGLLNWKTATEVNTSHFEVERSTDGRAFIKVGVVNAAGDASSGLYNYTDRNITTLGPPVVYYRLRMIDRDGAFKYSRIIAINVGSREAVVMLYPNPARESTMLMISALKKETIRYSIIDATGGTIATSRVNVNKGSNAITVDTRALTPGVYTLMLKGTETTREIRFVKQ